MFCKRSEYINNRVIVFLRVKHGDSGYVYDDSSMGGYKITHYQPIAMKFSMGCHNNLQLMLCRIVMKIIKW